MKSFFTKLLNQLVSDENFEMQCKLIAIVKKKKNENLRVTNIDCQSVERVLIN